MVNGASIEEMFEQAYRDLDRFIEDRAALIKILITNKPTGRILKGNRTYAEGWETGFRRCLAELEKASAKL
jgi:hypothetical protein